MKKKKIIKVLVICIALVLIVELYISNKVLENVYYTIHTGKMNKDLCVVQLTDLHNSTFGKDNIALVKKITAQKPDLICMTGDIIDRGKKDNIKDIEKLIEKLTEICPVFYSYGNHELDYIQKYGDIRSKLEEAGAVVLDNESVFFEIKGEKICIGGASYYAIPSESKDKKEYEFLKQFQQEEEFKLLLCHMPAGMLLWSGLEKWNVDLVLSGHEHGGQVRLPKIGGLYSQDEGWFPQYTEGKFERNNHTLILSKGLGSGKIIPRIGNRPEITVIYIKGQ